MTVLDIKMQGQFVTEKEQKDQDRINEIKDRYEEAKNEQKDLSMMRESLDGRPVIPIEMVDAVDKEGFPEELNKTKIDVHQGSLLIDIEPADHKKSFLLNNKVFFDNENMITPNAGIKSGINADFGNQTFLTATGARMSGFMEARESEEEEEDS